jgi:hypothetical protein
MIATAIILIVLASYVALMNLAGNYQTLQRRRQGASGGYSNVAIVSFAFCLLARRLAPDVIGPWAFIPAIVDPGTWTIVILPFFLVWRALKKN